MDAIEVVDAIIGIRLREYSTGRDEGRRRQREHGTRGDGGLDRHEGPDGMVIPAADADVAPAPSCW